MKCEMCHNPGDITEISNGVCWCLLCGSIRFIASKRTHAPLLLECFKDGATT
jgi:hypothetical protein